MVSNLFVFGLGMCKLTCLSLGGGMLSWFVRCSGKTKTVTKEETSVGIFVTECDSKIGKRETRESVLLTMQSELAWS